MTTNDEIIRAAADAIAVYRQTRRSRSTWVEAEAIIPAIAPLIREQALRDAAEKWKPSIYEKHGNVIVRRACPTCEGPIRETVGLVCQTCGHDYGKDAS